MKNIFRDPTKLTIIILILFVLFQLIIRFKLGENTGGYDDAVDYIKNNDEITRIFGKDIKLWAFQTKSRMRNKKQKKIFYKFQISGNNNMGIIPIELKYNYQTEEWKIRACSIKHEDEILFLKEKDDDLQEGWPLDGY